MRGFPLSRAKSAVLVAIVAACIVVPIASATAVEASCSGGICTWGYNYVTPSANNLVYTPVSNFWSETAKINSGGNVYLGFGGSDNCYRTRSVGTWTQSPGQLGCSASNNTAFVQYASGNSSYLHFEGDY